MRIHYTVYMNARDVTGWIVDLEVRHPRTAIYRQFDATFAGWNAIEGYQAGARWDVFGSYDPENPRSEVLIRAGVVPPDRERFLVIERGEVPTITVRGYDYVWLMQRRRPTETIVAVPVAGALCDEVPQAAGVAAALARYGGPVGRYRVWTRVDTVGAAVRRLGAEAGVNVDFRLPDHPLQSLVVPPERSYWEAIEELVAPWAPEKYFDRSLNTLVILDPESPRYQVGRMLNLAAAAHPRIQARPVTTNRVRRVIVRFPV